MAPVPMNEMLDELAVDVMDLQTLLSEESKIKHKQLIRKMLDKVFMSKKYLPIPEFEKGELTYKNYTEFLKSMKQEENFSAFSKLKKI
jgi:hypothetical protein